MGLARIGALTGRTMRELMDKDRLAIIKEVAKMYGIEVIECESGKGGFYAGDKKIEFSEIDFWDGLNEDYFKAVEGR